MDRKRARTARALANDERILDAATTTIASRGIDRFGLRDVAAEADLTYGALYGRYENATELLADLWQRRLRDEVDALAGIAAGFSRGTATDAELVGALRSPEPGRLVAVATLIAASRIDELQDIVPGDVAAILAAHGLRAGASVDPVGLGGLGILLGTAIVDRIEGPLGDDVVRELIGWLEAGRRLPWPGPPPAPHVPEDVEFHTGDELRDTLLTAAIRVVARSGVRGASLRRISRASGYSQTAVYAIYPSLEALLVDLVDLSIRWTQRPEQLTATFAGPEAAAARVAGWSHPSAKTRRRLFHEFLLAGAHDPTLAGLTASLDAELYGVVAGRFGPPGSPVHERALILLRSARNANFGITLLEELVGGMDAVDWRPFASAYIAGATAALQP